MGEAKDDWKTVVQWAAREQQLEQQEEKREARERRRRTWRVWPMIMVAVVPFGWLAFSTLDPVQGFFRTGLVLIVAVLVAEHLAEHRE